MRWLSAFLAAAPRLPLASLPHPHPLSRLQSSLLSEASRRGYDTSKLLWIRPKDERSLEKKALDMAPAFGDNGTEKGTRQ